MQLMGKNIVNTAAFRSAFTAPKGKDAVTRALEVLTEIGGKKEEFFRFVNIVSNYEVDNNPFLLDIVESIKARGPGGDLDGFCANALEGLQPKPDSEAALILRELADASPTNRLTLLTACLLAGISVRGGWLGSMLERLNDVERIPGSDALAEGLALTIQKFVNHGRERTFFDVRAHGKTFVRQFAVDAGDTLYYTAAGGEFVSRIPSLQAGICAMGWRDPSGCVLIYDRNGKLLRRCSGPVAGFGMDTGVIGFMEAPTGEGKSNILSFMGLAGEDLSHLPQNGTIVAIGQIGRNFIYLNADGTAGGNIYWIQGVSGLIDMTVAMNGYIGITRGRALATNLENLSTDAVGLTTARCGYMGGTPTLVVTDLDGHVFVGGGNGRIPGLEGAQDAFTSAAQNINALLAG